MPAAAPRAPLCVASGALALAETGAVAALAAVPVPNGVAAAEALTPIDEKADGLARVLWLAAALGVALRHPLVLIVPEADAELVALVQPLAALEGVSPSEALKTPLLKPLPVAARGALSVRMFEGVPNPELLTSLVMVPAVEREALVQPLAEPLPQVVGMTLMRAVEELLPQGLPSALEAVADSVASMLLAASALLKPDALRIELGNADWEKAVEPDAPAGVLLWVPLELSARGDCDCVEVAGSDTIWETEGVEESSAVLVSAALLLLASGEPWAVLDACAALSVGAALVVAASIVEVGGALGSAIEETEPCALLLAQLLVLASGEKETLRLSV